MIWMIIHHSLPHAQVVRMRGEGMPLRDDPASFGDLHVKAMTCIGLQGSSIANQITPKFSEAFEAWDVILGGGNSNIFLCLPRTLGKMNPF